MEQGTPCGALGCLAFGDPQSAVSYVLEQNAPLVLAIGEAHVQKGAKLSTSTAQQFSQLLPLFSGRCKHLIIELWVGRNDCGDQRVQEVKQAQEPVTSAQAETNQNDYLALGFAAKRLGIMPRALIPNCQQYQAVLEAGPDRVSRMLELIAQLTLDNLKGLLDETRSEKEAPLVLAYGGAMHNDAQPGAGREPWSFGPQLITLTNGHYVELDVFLSGQVTDSDLWKAQPWYQTYQSAPMDSRHRLYQLGPHSYTLILAQPSNQP